MAAGGWVGICIPEEFGGGGCGITEGALVLTGLRIRSWNERFDRLHLTMFAEPCRSSAMMS